MKYNYIMTNHPVVLNHVKDQTDKLKFYIKNKLYKNDPKKAKLDLFMIDQFYKELKNDNPEEAKDILDALTQKYMKMKKEKRWEKFVRVIAVIDSIFIGLHLLMWLPPPCIRRKCFKFIKSKFEKPEIKLP